MSQAHVPVTIVTGGSRGIGAATCLRLARDGHDVVIGYLQDAASARAVAGEVEAIGRRALAVQVDVADEASIDALFDAAAALGRVTGLVANAGIGAPNGRLADADPDALRRAIDVNLFGPILCARRAVRDLARNGGGAIVTISSVAASLGAPGLYVHYAASKAAIEALTVGLAKEVAADGIRVNCVVPGTTWTDFHEDPQRPAQVAKSIPMGRAGQPHEIAAAISWLLSDDASFTTGAILKVAGGL